MTDSHREMAQVNSGVLMKMVDKHKALEFMGFTNGINDLSDLQKYVVR